MFWDGDEWLWKRGDDDEEEGEFCEILLNSVDLGRKIELDEGENKVFLLGVDSLDSGDGKDESENGHSVRTSPLWIWTQNLQPAWVWNFQSSFVDFAVVITRRCFFFDDSVFFPVGRTSVISGARLKSNLWINGTPWVVTKQLFLF